MDRLPLCYRCGCQPCECVDGIALYHADCRDVLPLLPTVALLLTDPNYKISAAGGGIAGRRQYLTDIRGHIDSGFDVAMLEPFLNWFCFCAKEQLPTLLGATGHRRWMLLVWNKPNPTPLVNNNYLPDAEYIVHAFQPGRLFGSYRDRSRFILHPVGKSPFAHPAVKPLPVINKLVSLGSLRGELILDPFAGSGTTGRACKDLGRKCIMVEIEEKYCRIAANRLRQEVLF